jgi:hypothetical protein
MSDWLKAILIISLCFALLVIGAVGLGAYWWTKHRGELMKSAQSARDASPKCCGVTGSITGSPTRL